MSASFEAALQRLRADFLQQLPGRLGEAGRLMAACRRSPEDQESLVTLHRLLHTLAGSAGTFGRDDVGDGARAIEQLLDGLLHRPRRGPADFDEPARRLAALLDTLPQGRA